MKGNNFTFLVLGICAVIIGLAIFYEGGERPPKRDPNAMTMHILCGSQAGAFTAREAIIAGPSAPVGEHDCTVGAADVSMRDAHPIGMFNDYEGYGVILFEIKDGRYGFITGLSESGWDMDGYVDINEALDKAVAEFIEEQKKLPYMQ